MPEAIIDEAGLISPGHDSQPPLPPAAGDTPPGPGMVWDRKEHRWRPRRTPGRKPRTPPAGPGEEEDPLAARLRPEGPPRAAGEDEKLAGEASALMGLIGLPILSAAVSADPYCGGALVTAWPQISGACVPLLLRSASVRRFLGAGGGVSDWLALGAALEPVIAAVFSHHLFRTATITTGEESGDDRSAPQMA
jgi:hypothetical protein